ncbi:MAG TPA: hypothetical protein VFN48_02475 [Solirubrobacteraceae bacterium]|nr:hypothetical protein [Solirubrobacteraceae bacterium]
MDLTSVALTSARGRIAFGLLATALPSVVTRMMLAEPRADGTAPFVRMFGVRDAALGLGAVVAIDQGTPVRGWFEAMAMADAGDALTAVLDRRHLTPNAFRVTLGLAGGSALVHLLLGRRLDPHPPAHLHQPEAVATGHPEPA